MATPSVLAFDAEGRAIDFEVWVDDLQLFLQCDRVDGLSLFDLTSGTVPATAADADATVRSQWATRDAAARLAVRRHLPTADRAHFSQYKSAQTLYDAVVARYSSPATAALSRLMLPFLFPDLAAFPTVADLITHLRTSDTRYRAALPADFCAKNPPPMYITLYFLVTRLPDSLRVVRDHFLAGCSPSPLLPSVASAAAADLVGLESVGAASAPSGRRRSGKGKGGKGAGGASGGGGGGGGGSGGSGGGGGGVAGVGVLVAAVEAGVAAAVVVGAEVAEAAAVEAEAGAVEAEAGVAVVEVVGVALRSGAALGVRGGGFGPCTYVLRTGNRAGEQCGGTHTAQRCFGRLTDAWRQQFPEAAEIPRWGELSRAGVAIFDLDFDAILAAMYAVTMSDEGDCYRCFPPDPGIGTAALGASASVLLGTGEAVLSGTSESALSGTASASASHTFTLDSGASPSFFRDRTTLTPLSRPVAVSLADPSGGPVLSRFSTVLPCPAAPSGTLSGLYLPSFSTNLVSGADLQDAGVHQFTPARQRVTHCREASTGCHLATFTRQPGSSLYTLTTASPPVPESGRVPSSGQVFAAASRSGPESAPCSCRRLSHETLSGTTPLSFSLRLKGMASRLLVSGLPRSLPPLHQGPGPACVPCVEGRQRAAPHSSHFPPTEAPLQTLHINVWGPARVRGLGHERYFLLVVDDYSRYTTVFPLRSKGDVAEVLIDWIRAAHLQLRQSFGSDFPVLRLHSDNGGEFSSGLLRAYCRARGIRPPPVDPLPPQGPAPSGVSQVDAVEPVEVTGDSGAAVGAEPRGAVTGGAVPGGAESGGAEPRGVVPGGAEPEGAEPGGAEPGGAEPGGAEPGGAELGGAELGGAEPRGTATGGASPGGSPGASSRREPLSPQELREWFARRWRRAAGAGGSSAAEGAAAARPRGARTGSTGAAGPAGSTGAGAAERVGAETTAGGPAGSAPGAAGGSGATRGATRGAAGGALGGFGATGGAAGSATGAGTPARPVQSQSQLQPASPLPAPSPYAGPTGGLAEVRPPPVPGTHRMSLRPSTAPLRAPLPSPPASSLPALADPESDSLRAASPTVTRLLATAVTDPSFESSAASALVTELVTLLRADV
ncbi:unnamed protein product [Closterium sp. NIES-64]|nr:unnamed protein product [Closterium sp. NIES-64]